MPSYTWKHITIIGSIPVYSIINKAGERGGGGGGGKIPGARSAQRGPEISVKCSYIVYHRQFPEGQGPVFTNRHFVPALTINTKHAGDAMIFVLIEIENKVKALKNIY